MPELRVVAAALVRGRTVLAAQRNGRGQQALLWELPGGKVEPGETDPEALQRELREELQVEVEVLGYLAETVHPYPHATIRLVAWHCQLRSGDPIAVEHAALRWLGTDALSDLDWAPADRSLLPMVHRLLEAQPPS